MRIIVTGLVGLHPVGGVAWDYLQYPIGFALLGHEVFYHEDTWSWPYHPTEKRQTESGSYSAEYIEKFFQRYAPALADNWHYLHLHEHSYGMSRAAFEEVARTADLFVNVSGACAIPENLAGDCKKLFIDTDPGYNQIVLMERPEWSENVDRWCKSVADHDVHFTYAENIHGDDCLIPHVGYDWKTTRMPVVTDLWREVAQSHPSCGSPWSTILTWNAFKGPLVYHGVEYKSKGAEFRKFLRLPSKVGVNLQVAVGGIDPPLQTLVSNGWNVVDGPGATMCASDYQELIGRSRGEFSIAKNVYVATRSGWFSCRSACYLAAGRPVVVQDTGFAAALPTSAGIIAFDTFEEAVAGIERAERDWPAQSSAALAVAQEHFASDKVLKNLLDAV